MIAFFSTIKTFLLLILPKLPEMLTALALAIGMVWASLLYFSGLIGAYRNAVSRGERVRRSSALNVSEHMTSKAEARLLVWTFMLIVGCLAGGAVMILS
jgi:hypothetical protein